MRTDKNGFALFLGASAIGMFLSISGVIGPAAKAQIGSAEFSSAISEGSNQGLDRLAHVNQAEPARAWAGMTAGRVLQND
jgi:hypothetical protein